MKSCLVLWLSLLFTVSALAQMPAPPEVAAKQYYLLDITSGQVLAEREADAQADPASLTKLMTAYLVFNALRDNKLALTQKLSVSARAWAERKGGGSLMFVDTTMTPVVDELLRGMIVQSGNDAAVVLAEGVSGGLEPFVAAMNRQAQAWGLKNTQFKNVTGLSEAGHHSSARDMATIAAKIITEHPNFYPLYSLKEYTFNKIRQDNRNMLLGRDPSVDGMKTGFTDSAGYCLVASSVRELPVINNVSLGKRRLLSVVLGAASREARASESQKLLNWGWSAWDDVRLFDNGQTMASVPVWKGATATVKLGAQQAVFVSVPKGEGDKLKTAIERLDPLVAPLSKGQRVGQLKVSTANGTLVATVPLLVQEEVPLAGIFGRAWDAIRLWIK